MHTITRICQQHSVFLVGHRGRHTGRYGQSPFGRPIARPCANQFKRLIISPSIQRKIIDEPNPTQSQRTHANKTNQKGTLQTTRNETNKFKYTSGNTLCVTERIYVATKVVSSSSTPPLACLARCTMVISRADPQTGP